MTMYIVCMIKMVGRRRISYSLVVSIHCDLCPCTYQLLGKMGKMCTLVHFISVLFM